MIKYLLNYDFNNDHNDENLLSNQRLSHSFRYHYQDMDNSNMVMTAESYLKDLIKNNITMNDFRDFYLGAYFKEGVRRTLYKISTFIKTCDVLNF